MTFWNFVAMALAVAGVLYFLPSGPSHGNFAGFLTMFIVLFLTTGIGNGSTFRMIPVIFLTERQRAAAGKGVAAQEQATKDANKEAAAVPWASPLRSRRRAASLFRRVTEHRFQ